MKLAINTVIRGIKGAEGTWSKALVSVLGSGPKADVVELRFSSEDTAAKVEKVFAAAKEQGMSLTVECEEFTLAKVRGIEGVREESYTSKTGEAVTQMALYLRLGENPKFAIERIKADEGNLDALLDSLGDNEGNLDDLME